MPECVDLLNSFFHRMYEMKAIELEKDLWKHSFILSGGKGFFFRHCDSGFKSKWSGLWKDNKKYLEYYCFKVNGEWCGEKAISKAFFDGVKAVYEYSVKGVKVRETLLVPEGASSLMILIESAKEMDLEMELAVNIRRREENFTGRIYGAEFSEKKLRVWNDLGEMVIEGNFCFESNYHYKEHFPSGEKEDCFIPGKISAKGKKIMFLLKPDEGSLIEGFKKELKEKEGIYSSITRGIIGCNERSIVEGFNWSVIGLKLLENNESYYAGYPWFLQYWGRDLLWTLPGIIDLGYFGKAKKILLNLFGNSQEGRIPNYIEEGKCCFNSIDSSLLYVIALEHFAVNSGEKDWLKEKPELLEGVIDFILKQDLDRDGLIEHDLKENETWMDTLNRREKAVEVQALYIKALDSASDLFELLGEAGKATELRKMETVSRKQFSEKFSLNGFFADRIIERGKDGVKSCNALVPLMLGIAEEKAVNEFEKDIFSTEKGIRSRARGEEGYSGEGYHSGRIWSLATAWMSASEFRLGRAEKGMHFLNILLNELRQNCIAGIAETWNGEAMQENGCCMQLWGNAFIPRIIDEFMLGMKVNAFEKKISLNPVLPKEINFIKRRKRIGGKWINLGIEKKGKKIKAESSNRQFRIQIENI